MTNREELKEAVKRFCRTDEAADNLVSFIADRERKAVEACDAKWVKGMREGIRQGVQEALAELREEAS